MFDASDTEGTPVELTEPASTTEPPSSRGRRRSPDIEPRVVAAALRLYARDGWSGFTFDAAAREAGVGKPAIYRRWDSRAHLLVSACESLKTPFARDCGSFEADLRDYAQQFLIFYANATQPLLMRQLELDRRKDEELAGFYDRLFFRPRQESARDIVRRATARGEVHNPLDSHAAVELLLGAISTHWTYTSVAQLEKLNVSFPAYVDRLLAIILGGLEAREKDHE